MKIAIVHGYSASPQDHWFPWLADKLRAEGHDVQMLAMPESTAPVREDWEATLAERIGEVGEDTIVVTHSLGTITVLRWLLGLSSAWRLGGLVMVSGFEGALEALPDLDDYLAEPLPSDRLRELKDRITSRYAILSDDDPFVPPVASRELAAELDAPTEVVLGGGHFLADEGWTELPAALAAVGATVREIRSA